MKKVIKDLTNKGEYDITYRYADIGMFSLIALGLLGAKLCFIFVLKIMKGGKKWL